MCGIIGYIGDRTAMPILIKGLNRLEYRGYDSSGVAIMNDSIEVHKTIGRIQDLESILPTHNNGTMGIAHTRWATHGGVTNNNAHPHLSMDKDIAIVHNGIIENSSSIRNVLESKGIIFHSDTDTEVIVHLISMARKEGLNPLDSVRSALQVLRGTWGLCVMFDDSDEIICARNGSPLVIGLGESEMFISSDPHPLGEHTQKVLHPVCSFPSFSPATKPSSLHSIKRSRNND